jgi:competence protein ComEC
MREAVRTQYAASLVLLPLGVLFFSSVALVSPLANAFAIPLVSALIAPLALAGAALVVVWSQAGALLLGVAAWLTRALLWALDRVDPGGMGSLAIALPTALALCMSVLGCAWLLSPIPVPGRAVAALALLPLLFTPAQPAPARELRLTALDVGQGMAVLVETGGRRLLYDTGPRIGGDNEAGSRVIVPYLRSRGIGSLDALVVSHLDLDHSGGALSVLRNLPVDWVASSLPATHEIVAAAGRHFECRHAQRWRWGDAQFEWLHPGSGPLGRARSSTNARSCVLRIDTPAGSVLLAGDIEAAQERALVERLPSRSLRADVLLAPHHGSTTSSTPEFLDAVRPSIAIFQLGYRNRYRHPNPRVLDRYRERGIEILRSDAHAAISVHLRAGEPARVGRWRLDERRYWRIRLDGDED